MAERGAASFVISAKLPGKESQLGVRRLRRTNRCRSAPTAPGPIPTVVAEALNRIYGLSIQAVHYRGEAPM